MRILFINTGPWGTGSFTVIKGLSNDLIKLGHKVKIFFPDSNIESLDKGEYYNNKELYEIWKFPLSNKNIIIPTFPLMITDPHPRNPDALTFRSLTEEQFSLYIERLKEKILELKSSFQPDIIECHHIWLSSWICHTLGFNYVSVAHHSDQLGFRYDPRIKPYALTAAQNAKAIFSISESVKNEVMRLYHIDESKIILTANGYDQNVFKPMEVDEEEVLRELGVNIKLPAKIITFAGKLSRTKGFDILLQANKLIDPEDNIHFIIMGAGKLEDICAHMQHDTYSLHNVHIIGHQLSEKIALAHNIADLSVMPSKSEGFGISCLEAMGCGLPMVVTRSGGPETFAVGKIIDKGSPQELANAIMEILNLPEEKYQQLCLESLKAATKFSWKTIAEQHVSVYSEYFDIPDVIKR